MAGRDAGAPRSGELKTAASVQIKKPHLAMRLFTVFFVTVTSLSELKFFQTSRRCLYCPFDC